MLQFPSDTISQWPAGFWAFEALAIDRLTSASHSLLGTPQAVAYDPVGNRTTGGSVVNAGNQLTADATHSYQYDDNGNLSQCVDRCRSGLVIDAFSTLQPDPPESRVGVDRFRFSASAGYHGMPSIDPFEYTAIDIDDVGIASPVQLLRDTFTAISHGTIHRNRCLWIDAHQPIQRKILVTDPGGPWNMTHVKFPG